MGRLADYRLLQRSAVYYHIQEAADDRAEDKHEHTNYDVNCCHFRDSFQKAGYIVAQNPVFCKVFMK